MRQFSQCKIISTYKSIDGAICQPILPRKPMLMDFSKKFDDQSLCIEDLFEADETINYELKYESELRSRKIYFV